MRSTNKYMCNPNSYLVSQDGKQLSVEARGSAFRYGGHPESTITVQAWSPPHNVIVKLCTPHSRHEMAGTRVQSLHRVGLSLSLEC